MRCCADSEGECKWSIRRQKSMMKQRAGMMSAIGRGTRTGWRLPDRPMRMSLVPGLHPIGRNRRLPRAGSSRAMGSRRESQILERHQKQDGMSEPPKVTAIFRSLATRTQKRRSRPGSSGLTPARRLSASWAF